MMDDDLKTTSLADIAESLDQGIQQLRESSQSTATTSAEFHPALVSSLQELSLRITQLSGSGSSKTLGVVDLKERRVLVQRSRQALQEAMMRLKENNRDEGLTNSLKGCLVALRAAEHVAGQQVVAVGQPVFQTLAILEKSTASKQLFLNIKLLGMRLVKFLELCGRRVHDLRGPQRRGRVEMHVSVVDKLLPILVQVSQNAINRPMNAYDRASRDLFFGLVRQSTEAVVKLFTNPRVDELHETSGVGRFIRTVDVVMDTVDTVKTLADFETCRLKSEWLISFAMSVANVSSTSSDEKDIVNGCHHVVNELANLKEAIEMGDIADIALAKEVAKDFIEVTEQSVNSALLRLIVLTLSQLHVPLDRLIHTVLTSENGLPDRKQQDLNDLVDAADNHADRLFHIAQFATFCTGDSATSQSVTNSLHLAQLLEKELVPACLKLYFSPGDVGARAHLRTLRHRWRVELDTIESCVLEIVDPTAFCVIVEAEARRIASSVKKGQYSQDADWLRLSVSQVVRLCQMAVDFAWKEMSSSKESEVPNRLPEDHPIIRVERSTWEVQAALKMVIANVEDLHVHKVMIRRIQLMVTCMTAMVECLVDANRTEHQILHSTTHHHQSSGVKVLTSVSRVSISFDNKFKDDIETTKGPSARVLGKSFKNITMNNTIGVSAKSARRNYLEVIVNDIPLSSSSDPVPANNHKSFNSVVSVISRKMEDTKKEATMQVVVVDQLEEIAANANSENPNKEVFRKIKLHSDSSGFRSPLKQINNQLQMAASGGARKPV